LGKSPILNLWESTEIDGDWAEGAVGSLPTWSHDHCDPAPDREVGDGGAQKGGSRFGQKAYSEPLWRHKGWP